VDCVETAVEAHGKRPGRDEPQQLLLLHRIVDRNGLVGREGGDDRERRALVVVRAFDRSVRVRPPHRAVDHDHLAVERVERAEPEVAVAAQLADRQVAVVGAVEQGLQRRGLERDVRRVLLRRQRRVAQRLQVQDGDEPRVDRHASAG
jgi:hypothetical protein